MTQTRRNLLKNGLGLASAGCLSGVLPGLASVANAQSSGYKALVCVYLHGGMDAFDSFVPTGSADYADWASGRANILQGYEGNGDDSRARERLRALSGGSGLQVGLVPQLGPLADLYGTGRLGVVANVGPLVERTTRAKVRDGSAVLPKRLYSHNDQESLWLTSRPDSRRAGWGALMSEAINDVPAPLSAVSVGGSHAFLAGRRSAAFQVGTQAMERPAGTSRLFGSKEAAAFLAEQYRASASAMDNLFASDHQRAQRVAVDTATELSAMMAGNTDGDAVRLKDNPLSEQLAMVAKMIALRGQTGLSRQVFFVRMYGFDTHGDQAKRLPGLQAQLAQAMNAFYQETVRQGVDRDVLTFTTSEFGRTFTPNSDGTDHGWGGHQFFMGGSVSGGTMHGVMPEVGTEHDFTTDRGRLIPTIATDQFAAGLGKWFGLGDADLGTIFPNLHRFGGPLPL